MTDDTGDFHERKRAAVLEFERKYVAALLQAHPAVYAAARAAGLSRGALYALIDRTGIPLAPRRERVRHGRKDPHIPIPIAGQLSTDEGEP